MGYRSLRACVEDLERHGHLIRVTATIDPHLEMAEIQRRAYQSRAPAILFEQVKGSPFEAVSNLFGTIERARFIFRDTLARVTHLVRLKADPPSALKTPLGSLGAGLNALRSLPKRVRGGPVLAHRTALSQLPQIQSWPDDGGPFVTLPQVYSEHPERPGFMHSNLGMYRIQLAGNDYESDREVGLHYQIHRGIGVHHSAALEHGAPFPVSVFVGGPPAHTLAAVMPLPEGLTELLFAGMLNARRMRLARINQSVGSVVSTEADFCLVGTVALENQKPEGPFGDHLGYYSLAHDFPVLQVSEIYHRNRPIWPFTVVGRPPQEDTVFGQLIHEITAPMVPVELPGVKAIHAVDAAGVHPLLLAIGHERYVPYAERHPQELLTAANAILGFGQASLAKYLWIAAAEDDPSLDLHDVGIFFSHVLQRVDWRRDLHFQTKTTMDTLDYSGTALNEGSKLVIAAAGKIRRELAKRIPPELNLPTLFTNARLTAPGILALEAGRFVDTAATARAVAHLTDALTGSSGEADLPDWLNSLPLIVLVDDSQFVAESFRNFLWVTFTRSNPSHDVHGVASHTEHKHWACRGPLVIDARLKPHHAPPLVEDSKVSRRVDELCRQGGPLSGLLET